MVVSLDLREVNDQLRVGAQLFDMKTQKLDNWTGFN